MKLRHRMAVAFALAATLTLIAARLVTLASYNRIQQYELDQGLRARAESEAQEFSVVGRRALDADYQHESDSDPLEELVTYGALYRADGTVAGGTASFAHAPTLQELGIEGRAVGSCFDFRFRGKVLRGVLAEVRGGNSGEVRFLLVAASRKDLDADAGRLLAVGWWVLIGCLPLTLAVGWWLGKRMTQGIESVAELAQRVSAGEVDPKKTPRVTGGQEVEALGEALTDMVERLNARIETERRFASNAAHELRSPLAALRGELELALRRDRSKDEYQTALREALASTNRLIDLSEDLLVVARLGALTPDATEPVDLGALARDVVARVEGEAARASLEVDGNLPEVAGVPQRLERVLRNLVDNAVRHGAGRVRVKLSEEPRGTVRVAVEDDGPGIPEGDVERLFEPFYRGEQARQDSGAGLGLGIARDIARRHRGDLTLESPRGPTRFVVTLPAAPAREAAALPDG